MNILQSCLASISYLVHSFDQGGQLELSRIHKQLDALSSVRFSSFSPHTAPLREEAVLTLEALSKRVFRLSLPAESIEECARRIFSIHTKFVEAPKQIKERPEIKLCLTILCDFDSQDHNNAIGSLLRDLLVGCHPFVISRTLLKGSDVLENQADEMWKNELELLSVKDRWDIYEKNGLLLFFPNELLEEMTPLEKLKALDFIDDGTLNIISIEEALQPPKKVASVADFFSLFALESKVRKVFTLIGHGNVDTIASIDNDMYPTFLEFLEHQKCQALTVSSCFAGGYPSLMHLPQENSSPMASFEQPRVLSFPVIARSIGDFQTDDDCYERDYDLYYEKLLDYLESPVPRTYRTFAKMIAEIEGDSDEKSPGNLMQVYFPHSPESPGGFRAIGENRGFRLTVVTALQAMRHTEMRIENYNYVEVNPLVVKTPITFIENDPTLLSMIPGKGHHFFLSIELANQTPFEYLNALIAFYQENGINCDKGFFIKKLNLNQQKIENIVLHIHPKGGEYLFWYQNQYYHSDGNVVTKITLFQYRLQCKIIKEKTRSNSPEALRATTAGTESEDSFRNALEESRFYSWDKKISLQSLTKEEKTDLAFYLINEESEERALNYIVEFGVDVNSVHSLTKIPLVFAAVDKNMQNLLAYLRSRGVNQNVYTCSTTPLHRAAEIGDIGLLQLLLADPGLDLTLKDQEGRNCIAYAEDTEVIPHLINRGFNINEPDNEGVTPLGHHAKASHLVAVHQLLAAGADPNKGTPTPLTLGIQSKNALIVEAILEAGGKPFEVDSNGQSPLCEAVASGSLEIVTLLLKREGSDPNIADKDGVTPLLLAMYYGNSALIELLKEHGAKLPSQSTPETESLYERLFKRMQLLEQFNQAQALRREKFVAFHKRPYPFQV